MDVIQGFTLCVDLDEGGDVKVFVKDGYFFINRAGEEIVMSKEEALLFNSHLWKLLEIGDKSE